MLHIQTTSQQDQIVTVTDMTASLLSVVASAKAAL